MPRPTTPDHDKVIARLTPDTRRAILDRLCHRHPLVAVEYGYDRKLETATRIVGTLVGVAYSTSGGTFDVLVVSPASPNLRLRAISAAHVVRVRAAHPYGKARPGAFRLGEVLAGPPLDRDEIRAEAVAASVARTLDGESRS